MFWKVRSGLNSNSGGVVDLFIDEKLDCEAIDDLYAVYKVNDETYSLDKLLTLDSFVQIYSNDRTDKHTNRHLDM